MPISSIGYMSRPSQPPSARSTASLDREYLWHPFTPFDSWLQESYEILSIAKGEGCWLIDEQGRRYLDGNSSIWVNLHGHQNKRLTRAIERQLQQIAHSSFLGLTHRGAAELAHELILSVNSKAKTGYELQRVFFSDDGSTAIEAALKIVYQHFALLGQGERKTFVSLQGGYHGDTVGAMSVGQSPVFHGAYRSLLFPTESAMSPYCYRCPHNQATPERTDARSYRQCQWECVDEFKQAVKRTGSAFAGAVIEPLVQGAAGMIMHPAGYLEQIAAIVEQSGGKLILDEVMTGFYRTGELMAYHHETVQPDVVALAKGLTGGYLPLAATLVKEDLVEPFKGGRERTFFHGHSYSGNQLGCAAARENLRLLGQKSLRLNIAQRQKQMATLAELFWLHPNVGDVRQCGLILAIELVADWKTRQQFDPKQRIGWQVCEQARQHGLLTRPVGDVLLLMPPLVVKADELEMMVRALLQAVREVLP